MRCCSKNLTISGNTTFINSKHLDVNDPIITIGNNITNTNKLDSGILIKTDVDNDNNKYAGLIRKKNNSNFYLLTDTEYESSDYNISVENKATLITKNINTSIESDGLSENISKIKQPILPFSSTKEKKINNDSFKLPSINFLEIN